jgi:DNA-damage-inducible protein D
MLVPYGYFELEKQLFQTLYHALTVTRCRYSALDLMHALTYDDSKEFDLVLEKAKNACLSMQIPLSLHFKCIYISRPDGLYRDIRLSRFACYLVTINADSCYPGVMKARAYLVTQFKCYPFSDQ